MNKFQSTRIDKNLISSKEAIIFGLANDGGLYCPIDLKKYNLNELYDFSIDNNSISFKKISKKILSEFFKH